VPETPWKNDVGPWIGAGPDGHPPNAPTPGLEWTLTPVTIRRALDQSQALFAWRAAVVAGQADTRDVTVELLDSPGGHPVLTWLLHDAWPLSWSGPVLDASQPGVALEQAELSYARLRWLNQPQTGEA
jgi:phage tail-like protein